MKRILFLFVLPTALACFGALGIFAAGADIAELTTDAALAQIDAAAPESATLPADALQPPAEADDAEPPTQTEASAPVKPYVVVDETPALAVTIDAFRYELYEKRLFADVNADGKFNTSDARLLLRIAAKQAPEPAEVAAFDLNGDGRILSNDARLALRYIARLDTYYCTDNEDILFGYAVGPQNELLYFDALGALARGMKTIDGVRYYFDETSGARQTGFVQYRGSLAHFEDDGAASEGLQTLNGKTYLFVDAIAQIGWQSLGGKKYYFTADGPAATGWQTLDGKTYYLRADGSVATGRVDVDGKSYTFDADGALIQDGYRTENGKTYLYRNGKKYTGWLDVGLNSYYFGADGAMWKNTSNDNFRFDGDGVASARRLNHTTFHVYICGILKRNGASVSDIYRYVHNNFRYKYYAKGAPVDMAIRILSNGRGACYDFANLTKYLLEAAGYEVRIIVGDSFNPNNGSEHDWCLVKVNGVWRHLDTQRGYYLKTDAQMRSAGYGWRSENYPRAN